MPNWLSRNIAMKWKQNGCLLLLLEILMSLKTLSLAALAAGTLGLCSTAYAAHGIYVGGQVGYGNANFGSSDDDWNASISDNHNNSSDDGIAGRVYAGYQFNQYFGVETGYDMFSDSGRRDSNSDTKLRTQQWDLLGKVGLPVGYCTGFRADIKAGAAYSFGNDRDDWGDDDSNNNDINPAAGASISYNFNKNFAADVSYLHVFGSDHSNSPNTDLATVGVSYLFA